MFGWTGKLLRANLTEQKITSEEIDEKRAKNFMGGRGLGVSYLSSEVDPRIDPLSHENKLIFATGPATATYALGSSRYEVIAKSPLSGAIAGANSAGYWGPELKLAGYDMIIVEGKAKEPVYLWLNNEKAEIRSAKGVWGRDTYRTQELIRSQTKKNARVCCIGPAGENLVKFACIMNDKGRAAGRGGLGAIMGSRNLKAIAIKGDKRFPLADKGRLKELAKGIFGKIPKPMALAEGGTSYVLEIANELGILPTRNFQTGVFGGAHKIGGKALHAGFFIKRAHCYGCPVGCGRITRVQVPPFEWNGDGPEFEGLASLGSACGVDDLAAVIKAYFICNEMGIDVMSMGYTLSCAMELCQKGFLSAKDLGMKLEFGDGKAIVELVKKTAFREGFGNLLAEGSYRLAEFYGHPEFSMSVKKIELPGYDPRGSKGLGLGYAVSTCGASHMRSQFENYEALGMPYPGIGITEPLDRFSRSGKALHLINAENDKAATDSMGICAFLSGYKIGLDNVVEQLEVITGINYGKEGWLKAGERIVNLERVFNLGAGFTFNDDVLPKRFTEEPMPEGPTQGNICELQEMLDEYYQLRGWNR